MYLLTKQILPKRARAAKAPKTATKVKVRISINIASAISPLFEKKKSTNINLPEYGVDAYGFAKSKPVLLMDDENLLYLLGKYGAKARLAM